MKKTEAETMVELEKTAGHLESLPEEARGRIRDWAIERWPHLFGAVGETLAISGVPITSPEPFEAHTKAATLRAGVLQGDVLEGPGVESPPHLVPTPWAYRPPFDLADQAAVAKDGVALMEELEDLHQARTDFVAAVASYESRQEDDLKTETIDCRVEAIYRVMEEEEVRLAAEWGAGSLRDCAETTMGLYQHYAKGHAIESVRSFYAEHGQDVIYGVISRLWGHWEAERNAAIEAGERARAEQQEEVDRGLHNPFS